MASAANEQGFKYDPTDNVHVARASVRELPEPDAMGELYRSDVFKLWLVWTEDRMSTVEMVPELWRVWATDPRMAIGSVRNHLRQVRDDYSSMIIGVVETSHECML